MEYGKAAVFTGINQPLIIKDFPITPPEAGQALLKLEASGVCGTDLHIYTGRLAVEGPMIIGHEFVGRVKAISDADSKKYGIKQGDCCIVCVASPCGHCLLCKSGDDANCVNMGVTYFKNPETPPHLHGGFADHTYAPVKNLIKVPESLDPVTVSIFACAGPTVTHAFRLARQSGVEKAKTAVVQGGGPIGTFAVMLFAAAGAKNIVVILGRKEQEREKALKKAGATLITCIAESGFDAISKEIFELTGGLGADVVFEGSGNPAAFPQGLSILRNRGVYMVPGQYSNSGNVEIGPQIITFKALQIIGSSQYSVSDVKSYLKFMEDHPEKQGLVRSFAKLYKLEDINQAFAANARGENTKTVIVSNV